MKGHDDYFLTRSLTLTLSPDGGDGTPLVLSPHGQTSPPAIPLAAPGPLRYHSPSFHL